MKTCEEYRQAIAADPSFDGGAAHLSTCESCQAFREEMLALDAQISRALSIPVPEINVPELPEIDTSNVTPLPKRFGTPVWLAAAASVVIAAVIGFNMLGDELSNTPLGDQIIAHIEHEPYALRNTSEAVTDQRLTRVVPPTMATLDHDAGLITYAQSCVINGHTVPHLVIQGERGPVTILLMPEEMVEEAYEISGERTNGVILPVGNGSIAIIGEDGERLDLIEEEVRNSVRWTT